MVTHIVLFNFSHCLTEEAKIAEMFHQLKLKQKILKFQSYHYGINISTEALQKGFTHGFTMCFATTKDRDDYLVHPDHLEIVEKQIMPLLQNNLDRVLVFDLGQ